MRSISGTFWNFANRVLTRKLLPPVGAISTSVTVFPKVAAHASNGSTPASAINATLYGTARLTAELAIDGELPEGFEERIAGRPLIGLFTTSAAAVVLANLVPLDAISATASAAFLLVFAATNVAALRLADEIGANRIVAGAAAIACTAALGALLVHTVRTSVISVALFVGLLALSALGEATYQWRRRAHGLDDPRAGGGSDAREEARP